MYVVVVCAHMMPSCATVLVLGVLAMIPYLVMTSWFAARAPAVDVSPAGGAGADLDLGIYTSRPATSSRRPRACWAKICKPTSM